MPDTILSLRPFQLIIEGQARRSPSGSVQTDEVRRGVGRGSLFILVDCDDPRQASHLARQVRTAYAGGGFTSATDGLIAALVAGLEQVTNIEEAGPRGAIVAVFRDDQLYAAAIGEASIFKVWRKRNTPMNMRPTSESAGGMLVNIGHCDIAGGDLVIMLGRRCARDISAALSFFIAEHGVQEGLLECHKEHRRAFPANLTVLALAAETHDTPDRPPRPRPARRLPRHLPEKVEPATEPEEPEQPNREDEEEQAANLTSRARTRRIPQMALVSMAIVLLVGLVLIMFRAGSSSCDVYEFLQVAERREVDAQSTNDTTTKRRLLLSASQSANRAIACAPDDRGALSVRNRIQEQLDELDNVVTSSWGSTRIVNSEGVSQVVLSEDTLYVLDQSDGSLSQYHIAGHSLVPVSGDGVLLRRGDRSKSITAGELVGIDWALPGGGRDAASLVCLDRNGLLFEYEPGQPLTVTTLKAGPDWTKVRSIGSYAGALYILLPQIGGVVWYQAAPDGYTGPPMQYLEPAPVFDPSGARQMVVDEDIWLLMNEGRIKRLHGGREVPLELKTPEGALVKVARLHLRHGWLFAADVEGHRIVQFDRSGGFVQQWRYESDNDLFIELRDFAVDRAKKRVLLVNNRGVFLLEWPGEG
jgi:hypothetical protein